jgi:four helix bundle protein
VRRPADKHYDPRTNTSRSDEHAAPPPPTTKVWHRNRAPLPQSAHRPKSEGELHYAIASSQSGPGGYKKFGDIPAHKLGKALRGRLYQVANALPDSEHGNLVSRIKHAATTVTAALAQGFGEGTFRAGINRALESRGALMAIQDHIEQLGELGFLEPEEVFKLKDQVDAVFASLNEYVGSVVKEQQHVRSS